MSGIKTEYKHNHSGINKTKHKGMLYQLLMLGEKENCAYKYYKCGSLKQNMRNNRRLNKFPFNEENLGSVRLIF